MRYFSCFPFEVFKSSMCCTLTAHLNLGATVSSERLPLYLDIMKFLDEKVDSCPQVVTMFLNVSQ